MTHHTTTDTDTETEVPDSYRPALVKLSEDIQNAENSLHNGFDTREGMLLWLQNLSAVTLGSLPHRLFEHFAEALRTPAGDTGEHPLIACLLTQDARTRDISQTAAETFRERLAAVYIRPSHHSALKHLRASATEYIEEGSADATHNPQKQRYIAMRPALNELRDTQQHTLEALLQGFKSTREILEWHADLELSTHGELDGDLAPRLLREQSLNDILTTDTTAAAGARQYLAAHTLLPAYSRGVRDLAGRASEQPEAESDPMEAVVA